MEGIKTKVDYYFFNYFLVIYLLIYLFIYFGGATQYAGS